MKIKNVILDFGHGGLDASGNYTTAPSKMHKFCDGVTAYEGELNREIGGLVYWLLKNSMFGVNIHTTVSAEDSRDLSLGYRVRLANQFPAAESIFISIHCNASVNHNAEGFEIFTTRRQNNSDLLAESIFQSVKLANLGIKMRSDMSDGDSDKEADHYVTRKVNCPAVLIECGFFDYRPEFERLKDPKFQKDMAFAIYQGIRNYIS